MQTHCSERHQSRSRRETICKPQCALAANGIQSQTDRCAAGSALHFIAKILAIDEHDVAAFHAQFINQFRASDNVHRFVAQLVCNLDHRPSGCRVGRVLNQPISFSQIDIIMEQTPRRHRIDFQHCRVHGLDSRRYNDEIFGFHDNGVTPCADVVRQDYQVTHGDIRHVRAKIDNHSRTFEPGRCRELWSQRIFSFDLI